MPSPDKNNKIFIANISSKVRESDLEKVFEPFGKIVDLRITERREIYAVIEYENYKDAEEAA
jgi:RNA recognition motif-containing protein